MRKDLCRMLHLCFEVDVGVGTLKESRVRLVEGN